MNVVLVSDCFSSQFPSQVHIVLLYFSAT